MKAKILTLIGVLGVTTTLFASTEAEVVFDNKCAVCHIKTMPTDRASMVAPALNGVMRHIKMVYPNKDDAVTFMVEYVQNPTKEKAVCMAKKIQRFGVMPSQKGNITPQELKEVAGWMFDNYPAANFRGQGMNSMQNRPTFAMFDTNNDGKITPDEFASFQANHMNKRKQQKSMKSRGNGCRKNRSNFPAFDLNKDGVITKDELLKVRGDKQAKRAAQGMPMRNAANAPSFESIDSDGDGKIRPDEFDKRR